jgi:hypothetical protein
MQDVHGVAWQWQAYSGVSEGDWLDDLKSYWLTGWLSSLMNLTGIRLVHV